MVKPLILGILFNISIILVLQFVCLTSPIVSGVSFSSFDLSVSYLVFKRNPLVSILFTLATNLSYTVFLTTLFFNTSDTTGTNLSINI